MARSATLNAPHGIMDIAKVLLLVVFVSLAMHHVVLDSGEQAHCPLCALFGTMSPAAPRVDVVLPVITVGRVLVMGPVTLSFRPLWTAWSYRGPPASR